MSTAAAQLARLDERTAAILAELTDLKSSMAGVLADHEQRIRSLEARWWRVALAVAVVAGGTGGVASQLLKAAGG